MKYYEEFTEWLEKYLKSFSKEIIAVNFNLYEGENNTYDIQLIGSDEFDESDSDWACSEIFSTEEDIFYIERTQEIARWEDGLEFITNLVKKYLEEGEYAYKLKGTKAVSIGFVDGDLKILYISK